MCNSRIQIITSLVRLTYAVFIDNCYSFPLIVGHNIQNGPANGAVLWIEIYKEGVLVVHKGMFPMCLDVRDFQGITDGLDRTD